jgi:hypothetical protein
VEERVAVRLTDGDGVDPFEHAASDASRPITAMPLVVTFTAGFYGRAPMSRSERRPGRGRRL